jgi:hypothetical protein
MDITVPVHEGGIVRDAALSYDERDDGMCEISISTHIGQFAAVAETLWDALISIRSQLEPRGLLVAVRGASIDVWPSPMQLDMGSASIAYRMTLGKQALQKDLVEIFEVSGDVVPATVAAQAEYRDRWFKSLIDSRPAGNT